eukprot:9493289-Pyramimonas_sp.AAC.1
MYKAAGRRRNREDMRGQAETRLKNTTVGMLRKSCCFEMGWWGYAKREEFYLPTGPQERLPEIPRPSG